MPGRKSHRGKKTKGIKIGEITWSGKTFGEKVLRRKDREEKVWGRKYRWEKTVQAVLNSPLFRSDFRSYFEQDITSR